MSTLEPPEGLRISMADIMEAGYCPSGARAWFGAHGIDAEFRTLIKGGTIDANVLLNTDACGEHVVAVKMERRRG